MFWDRYHYLFFFFFLFARCIKTIILEDDCFILFLFFQVSQATPRRESTAWYDVKDTASQAKPKQTMSWWTLGLHHYRIWRGLEFQCATRPDLTIQDVK